MVNNCYVKAWCKNIFMLSAFKILTKFYELHKIVVEITIRGLFILTAWVYFVEHCSSLSCWFRMDVLLLRITRVVNFFFLPRSLQREIYCWTVVSSIERSGTVFSQHDSGHVNYILKLISECDWGKCVMMDRSEIMECFLLSAITWLHVWYCICSSLFSQGFILFTFYIFLRNREFNIIH